jgi:hypothetical protein
MSYYMFTATNKQLLISESRGDLNRCTPCKGKIRPIRHTLFTLSPHMPIDHTYLIWFTYSNLSRSHQQSWAGPLLLSKRALDTIHSTSADRSACPYPVSLSSQPMKQWGAKPTFCWWPVTKLTGLILPACDRYVQYLLAGAIHRSLTDTGGGYNLEGVGLPHTTHRSSQPAVSTFHLWSPLSLQFNHKPIIKPKFEFKGPMTGTWSSNHSAIYRGIYLCLAIANDPSQVIWLTKIVWKVILMQLGY